jgi:hypothetical protein
MPLFTFDAGSSEIFESCGYSNSAAAHHQSDVFEMTFASDPLVKHRDFSSPHVAQTAPTVQDPPAIAASLLLCQRRHVT